MNNPGIYIFLFTFICANIVFSQQKIPLAIQQKMEEMGVQLLYPIEQKSEISFKKVKKNSYAGEDLRIKKGNEEIMIFFYPRNKMKMDFPHLEFNRLLTHLASNKEEDRVFIYKLPESGVIDWQGEARFITKRKVSNNRYAIAYGSFLAEKGLVIAIHMHKNLQADYDHIFTFDSAGL
jgi:hypothetical protein